jgi:Phage integrase family
MRALLLAEGRQRDAVLLCLLAYAGLRPGEALALRWSDVREWTLLIEKATSDGEIKSTQTGQLRAVRLLKPLKDDLELWRLSSPHAGRDDLVVPGAAGAPFKDHDWRNWRRRAFDPVAKAVGLDNARPYDLRHSFVSLPIFEGRIVVEVAAQAPTMTLSTYARVVAELEGRNAFPRKRRSSMRAASPYCFVPAGEGLGGTQQQTPANGGALCRTRTGDPFLTIASRAISGSGAVRRCPAKSLQSPMLCRLDMTGVYPSGRVWSGVPDPVRTQ